MAYLILSRNGEESFKKLLSPDQNPDLDHFRRGPSHGYDTPCSKNQVNQSDSF